MLKLLQPTKTYVTKLVKILCELFIYLPGRGLGSRFDDNRLTLRIHRGRGSARPHGSPLSTASNHSTSTSLSASPERLRRYNVEIGTCRITLMAYPLDAFHILIENYFHSWTYKCCMQMLNKKLFADIPAQDEHTRRSKFPSHILHQNRSAQLMRTPGLQVDHRVHHCMRCITKEMEGS